MKGYKKHTLKENISFFLWLRKMKRRFGRKNIKHHVKMLKRRWKGFFLCDEHYDLLKRSKKIAVETYDKHDNELIWFIPDDGKIEVIDHEFSVVFLTDLKFLVCEEEMEWFHQCELCEKFFFENDPKFDDIMKYIKKVDNIYVLGYEDVKDDEEEIFTCKECREKLLENKLLMNEEIKRENGTLPGYVES